MYPGIGFPAAPRSGSRPGYARRNSFHAASGSRYAAERTGGRAATLRASPSASAEGTSARSTAVMAYRSASKRLTPPDRSRETSAKPRKKKKRKRPIVSRAIGDLERRQSINNREGDSLNRALLSKREPEGGTHGKGRRAPRRPRPAPTARGSCAPRERRCSLPGQGRGTVPRAS